MIRKISEAISKFQLDLRNKVILTEAATGNYAVTPTIAAAAGGKVIAFARHSQYGSIAEARQQVTAIAKSMGGDVSNRIHICADLMAIDTSSINIVTNCGLLRPIDSSLIGRLSSGCVLPLMYEPWEFRVTDVDLEACWRRGIKVYGTNESDERLRTMGYIGHIVLYFLLKKKLSAIDTAVLLLGCRRFTSPVENVLGRLGYDVSMISDYGSSQIPDLGRFQAVVVLEHERDIPLIGSENAFIHTSQIPDHLFVIHICGRVDFSDAKFAFIPPKPREFGHMSFTTDFIDNRAVIDLHTAGLKVAEGMLKANDCGFMNADYKSYMERNYPALSFEDKKYW